MVELENLMQAVSLAEASLCRTSERRLMYMSRMSHHKHLVEGKFYTVFHIFNGPNGFSTSPSLGFA